MVYVKDSMPSEYAGAAQLDRRVVSDRELTDRGMATWCVTTPVTPFYGPLSLNVDVDAICVPETLSAQSQLEREADRILRFHDGDAMNLDTLRERTRANGVDSTWDRVVKADRAAFRGKVRFIPNSHSYKVPRMFIVAGDSTCTVSVDHHRLTTFVTGRGYRFVCHKAVRSTRATDRHAVKRAKRAATRAPSMAAYGKAATPYSAGESTIRRRWSKVDAGAVTSADVIANALRHVKPGEVVPIADGVTVTVHASTVTAFGREFPIRDFARRVVLAGDAATI